MLSSAKRNCEMGARRQDPIWYPMVPIYISVDPDVSENLFVSIPIYFPSEICQK